VSDSMPEDYGQGESGPIDNSNDSTESNGSESTATNESGAESGTGYNPNWDEAFTGLPPEFHDKLKPVFTKWDSAANQRYEKVQQEYAPYSILKENNVSIDDVRQAFELRNQIAANPREMFDRLAAHLQIDLSSLNGNAEPESQGLNALDPDEDEDPRIAAIRAENEQIKHYLLTQEQEKQAQREAALQEQTEKGWYESTVSELNTLETTYGKFDRNRAVQFAVWEAERTGNEFSLEAGVKAMNEFRSSAIQSSANAQAPDVFSGNGSLASGRVDTSKMNESEFEKYAIERIKAKNAGG